MISGNRPHKERFVTPPNRVSVNPAQTSLGVMRSFGHSYTDPSVLKDMKLLPNKIVDNSGEPLINAKAKGDGKCIGTEYMLEGQRAVITVPSCIIDASRQSANERLIGEAAQYGNPFGHLLAIQFRARHCLSDQALTLNIFNVWKLHNVKCDNPFNHQIVQYENSCTWLHCVSHFSQWLMFARHIIADEDGTWNCSYTYYSNRVHRIMEFLAIPRMHGCVPCECCFRIA